MSRRTPTEEKALAWYCEEHDLVPQLGVYPNYDFKNRHGVTHTKNMEHIVLAYKHYLEQERKAKKGKSDKDGTR